MESLNPQASTVPTNCNQFQRRTSIAEFMDRFRAEALCRALSQ